MTRVVRLGFAGCGEVAAEKHMPALAELAGFAVAAAADRESARLDYVQRRFGIRHRHAGVDDLVANPEVDAVALCLPPTMQVAAAITALENGKHVWIDPPTGLTLDECDRLIDKSMTAGRTVMVGFHMRWHRLAQRARAMIASGDLGTLHALRAVWSSPRDEGRLKEWRRHRSLGGGALVEVAIDHFDLWRYLLGTEIAEVVARSVDDRWDDAAAVVAGRMADGVLVSAVFAERGNHDMEIEVYGDRGRLRVSLTRFEGFEVYRDGMMAGDPRARIARIATFLRELPRALPRMHRMGDYRLSYRDQWSHFHDCVVLGKPPQCSLDDAREALKVMLACLASAKDGRPSTP